MKKEELPNTLLNAEAIKKDAIVAAKVYLKLK
jgi:hypothetical protein